MGRPPLDLTRLLAEQPIKTLLTNLWIRKGKFYYLGANGELIPAHVSAKLVKLTSSKTSSRLLREAIRRGIILVEPEPTKETPAKAVVRSNVKPQMESGDDEDEDSKPKRRKLPQKSRYSSLIYTNNGWIGIWDEYECKPKANRTELRQRRLARPLMAPVAWGDTVSLAA
jgi:hypothetical protein